MNEWRVLALTMRGYIRGFVVESLRRDGAHWGKLSAFLLRCHIKSVEGNEWGTVQVCLAHTDLTAAKRLAGDVGRPLKQQQLGAVAFPSATKTISCFHKLPQSQCDPADLLFFIVSRQVYSL